MKKLKLACADFTFPLLPHDQALSLIAMLGIEGVDIGLFEGRSHLRPSTELKRPAENGARLKKRLQEAGVVLADLFLIPATNFADMAPNHPSKRVREKAREQFQRTVEFAVAAGGSHVGGLPGVFWDTESKADSLQRSSDELAWRAAYARAAKVVYSVEPHVGSVIPKPSAAAALVARTPGLTLTLDYTHFTSRGLKDAEIEPLIELASHFHCRGACKGRLQSSAKQNTIDYQRVLRLMKKTGYRGFVGIEYVWMDWEHCNETDNLSETIIFRDQLRREMEAWR